MAASPGGSPAVPAVPGAAVSGRLEHVSPWVRAAADDATLGTGPPGVSMLAGSRQVAPVLVKSRIARPSITIAYNATTPRESTAMAAALCMPQMLCSA